jgi:Ca2+-binding RTX toxin-like protein
VLHSTVCLVPRLLLLQQQDAAVFGLNGIATFFTITAEEDVFITGGITMLLLLLTAAAVMASLTVIVVVFAENIQGTSGDDTLYGTPESDTISGFEGNDKLFGEGDDDFLDGGTGKDGIYGGDGNDEIKDGNDEPYSDNKVYGGSGNDNIDVGIDYTRVDYYYVYAEAGSDYIEVVSNAFIKGGPDNDTIYCRGYECIVNGDEGDDEIHAELYDIGSGVSGGSGNDKLYFNGGGGYQSGDDGNDYLLVISGGGNVEGGEGDDVLEASDGDNFYNGGLGADTFNCSPGLGDIVEDYNPEEGDSISADCEIVEDATGPDVQ